MWHSGLPVLRQHCAHGVEAVDIPPLWMEPVAGLGRRVVGPPSEARDVECPRLDVPGTRCTTGPAQLCCAKTDNTADPPVLNLKP